MLFSFDPKSAIERYGARSMPLHLLRVASKTLRIQMLFAGRTARNSLWEIDQRRCRFQSPSLGEQLGVHGVRGLRMFGASELVVEMFLLSLQWPVFWAGMAWLADGCTEVTHMASLLWVTDTGRLHTFYAEHQYIRGTQNRSHNQGIR